MIYVCIQEIQKSILKSGNMKTLLKSLKLKYLVNVLLIVIFGITAQTGLFDGGGEHEGRRGEHGRVGHSREQSSLYEQDLNSMNEAEIIDLMSNENKTPRPTNEKDNTHVYLGLSLLSLMLLHIAQHWSWFKKVFTWKHLAGNKLLWATAVFFIAMAVSGLILWTEVVPRDIINFKEIHEITGQVLIGLILIHIVQRFKWYINSTGKLFQAEKASITA